MNEQMAFMGSNPLSLHSFFLQQQHVSRAHPTQQLFREGGMAPPSSAGFSGAAQRRLPFRPAAAGLPVVDDHTHTNSNHHQAFPHPNQNTHHHDAFLHQRTLRMGSFEHSQNEELARLQELSNKWEPEANASSPQNISPRMLCFRFHPATDSVFKGSPDIY
jgi:hypothetical protein